VIARVLIGFVLFLVTIWVVAFATGEAELRRALREPWPYGLGSVEQLMARPRPTASSEAWRLMKLLNRFPFVAGSDTWLAEQVKKTNDDVDPPPGAVDQAKVAEVVRFILAANDRLRWGTRAYRVTEAAEALGVAALERARSGDPATAWDDVHAMWILARSVTHTHARIRTLELERLANGIARKLPPPVPEWTVEMATFDPRRDAAAALQINASFYAQRRRGRSPAIRLDLFFRPLIDRLSARSVRETHAIADAMTARRCRVDEKTMKDATMAGTTSPQIVYRAARFDAEEEATAKLLALKAERARSGRWPALFAGVTDSRCAESSWQYEVSPDGSHMELRMSKEPAEEPSAGLIPQLVFAY